MTQTSSCASSMELVQGSFKDLLVAHDFSDAADTSLKYAVLLAKHFGSFVHLINVQTPVEYATALDSGTSAKELSRDKQSDLCKIQECLRKEGIESDTLRRTGSVADVLGGAIIELTPDLLFLGAYGYGPTDRARLGSTAEHILRTAPCPVLTVGPDAIVQQREAPPIKRILCPSSSLEKYGSAVDFAGRFASLLRAELEIFHVVDPVHYGLSVHKHEQKCEQWAERLRASNIPTSWTVLYGQPEEVIAARAAERKSSLIIFGLHRTGNRMVDCPDGVVSATIHRANCPVVTAPISRTH
jgi:nucleotide-binding universal stress UspA family protein